MSKHVTDFDVNNLSQCIDVLELRFVATTTTAAAAATTASTAPNKQQSNRRRLCRPHHPYRDERRASSVSDDPIEIIRSLSIDDVERAYRRMARMTHPDKAINGNGSSSSNTGRATTIDTNRIEQMRREATVRFQRLEPAKQKIIEAIKQRIWNTHRATQSQEQQSQQQQQQQQQRARQSHSAHGGDESNDRVSLRDVLNAIRELERKLDTIVAQMREIKDKLDQCISMMERRRRAA